MDELKNGDDDFVLNVEPELRPAIERQLNGTTELDADIASLSVPESPSWLNYSVRLLRWYRRQIASRMGARCVFDPSCSHYCEHVMRERGFFKGVMLTLSRLRRCKPGAGGIDLPK